MHHENAINYDGGMEKLATDIGNLKYDALADFLYNLACKISEDAHADSSRGYNKMATELHYASASIRNAWIIAKPHMQEQDVKERDKSLLEHFKTKKMQG